MAKEEENWNIYGIMEGSLLFRSIMAFDTSTN